VRLTLRTLLAYLDDTLEPAQAKLIGQKVAESDTAQELIARIKQVTRRRRLTVPPPTGPGGRLDPNTVAEYLDNALSADQTAEVEQVALGSDVHLADIAACHQILTLVLGEPVLIPPSSRQRMYGLVKGREAIPFRRPPGAGEGPAEPEAAPDQETDETLRLGLPAYRSRGSWSSQLAVIGGAAAAALLLILAIWQALRSTSPPAEQTSPVVAENQTTRRTEKARTHRIEDTAKAANPSSSGATGTTPKGTSGTTPKAKPATTVKQGNEEPVTKPGNKGTTGKEKNPVPPDVTVASPSTKVRPVGEFVPVKSEPSLLVQQGTKNSWRILNADTPALVTGQPLVSLPGCTSDTKLKSGLHLKLQGVLPEQFLFPPPKTMSESRLVLHDNSEFAADLTLQRGRIILSNPRLEDLTVRLRVDNPTNPDLREVWDMTLTGPGTRVLVDLWHLFPLQEQAESPDDPNRKGPIAFLEIAILNGGISLTHDKEKKRMEHKGPQGWLRWNSRQGTDQLTKLDEDVTWFKSNPSLPPIPPDLPPAERKQSEKIRTAMVKNLDNLLKARDAFVQELAKGDNLEVSLDNILKNSPNKEEHVLVVRSYGALDDLPDLVDALDNEDQAQVRLSAIATLRVWIADARDNETKLVKVLKAKGYSKAMPEHLLRLLHYFTPQQAIDPVTFDFLIAHLNDRKIALRELAREHLYGLDPMDGAKIPYRADGSETQRERAQQAWSRLLERGQLPPRPMGPPQGGVPK
jgi:hypothetical protein